MQINLRRRKKKRLPRLHPMPLVAGDQINSSWAIDFMSNALWDGRRFRTFNVSMISVSKR
jgi:putative transposase